MIDPSHPIAELLKDDDRFAFEAYVFVFEALSYAQNVLEMGTEIPSELPPGPDTEGPDTEGPDTEGPGIEGEEEVAERHVSGQELCDAIRRLALQQYGYMAKTVLNNWGLRRTGDFGEIVFNLIRIGQMRKTAQDVREDFEDVYEFETAFREEFKIRPPE